MRLPSAISLTALLAFSACQDGTSPAEPYFPPWPTPEYAVFYGGGLRLSVFEAPGDHAPDSAGDWRWNGVREPRVVLALRTVREWGGCGAWLEAEVTQEGNVTTVTAGRVFTVLIPCTGSAPTANFSQFLSFPEGENILLLDVLGQRFEYRVRVSPPSIDLVRLTPGGAPGPVRVEEDLDTFWRFPSHSAVVYCGGQSPTESCEALFDEIAREPGVERYEFPAWGHPPFPRVGDAADGTAHFRFESDEGFTRLQESLCRAAPLPLGSGRVASALSWRNEEASTFRC